MLADANVLYSRVLRDYLLYAADQEIIAIAWSHEILAEVPEHLGQNVAGFDDAAAEATVLCTSNTKDFPDSVVKAFGIDVVTPDQLLSQLVAEYEPQMLAAHRAAVASLNGATDASTVGALRRAGAARTAALMARLVGVE